MRWRHSDFCHTEWSRISVQQVPVHSRYRLRWVINGEKLYGVLYEELLAFQSIYRSRKKSKKPEKRKKAPQPPSMKTEILPSSNPRMNNSEATAAKEKDIENMIRCRYLGNDSGRGSAWIRKRYLWFSRRDNKEALKTRHSSSNIESLLIETETKNEPTVPQLYHGARYRWDFWLH